MLFGPGGNNFLTVLSYPVNAVIVNAINAHLYKISYKYSIGV